MFRKPVDDDDDDYSSRKTVKAKPIAEKYARKLGEAYGQGKDFVVGSSKAQDFVGNQAPRQAEEDDEPRALSAEEKNKLSAKILKAEMKGDTDLVRKLKRKLESGVDDEPKEKTVVMMKRDRTGAVVPATKKSDDSGRHAQSSSRMQREYGKEQKLEDMVREEKTGTAEDQLALFNRSIVKSAKIKRHDDESVDDIAEMQNEKKRTGEKDERKREHRMRKEHRQLERSLDDCDRCIESRKLAKHCVVATGIHTYLAVVEWDGLDEEHCIIVPTGHASSSIQLDENVWDEMRIWRKGLVAMWNEQDKDCVFMEMARNVKQNPHMYIECVPLPREIGDMAPIYFKKAINESEGEYVDNKKLIDTKDLRRQIPKGFSYFAVDFGLSNGYAHVIENPELFPASFGHELIAGMLDLPASKWRKKDKQTMSECKLRTDALKERWAAYDWTKRIPKD